MKVGDKVKPSKRFPYLNDISFDWENVVGEIKEIRPELPGHHNIVVWFEGDIPDWIKKEQGHNEDGLYGWYFTKDELEVN